MEVLKLINEVYLINKETLETDKIVKVGKTEGQLLDAKTKKVLQTWDATQYETITFPESDPQIGKDKIIKYTDKLGEKSEKSCSTKIITRRAS